MGTKQFTIVGLGEILWDVFPAGKKLGGAPANFAHAAALLGDRGTVASRIGIDSLGNEVVAQLSHVSLSSGDLQIDDKHATGTVNVSVDDAGQPGYEIVEPVAWDYLEWTSAWRDLAGRADAVCFGSLAQRSSISRYTIRNFITAMRPGTARVFDVNLRQKFFSAEVVRESMALANIVKLNQDELPVVLDLLGIENGDPIFGAGKLLTSYDLDLICVTRGNRGSLLMNANEAHDRPGFKVQVADTVGAGDAFTAGLVHQYLRKAALQQMNELANRMGAWVSTQNGAMPRPDGDLKSVLENEI